MSWGVPRRPKISTKLGNPNPREGSDGDIQIKGTALGAKLWGKWSGRWWDVPLSKDGVTKFGVTDSNYLSIDRDSVDIFKNKVKVASFADTTTIGNSSTEHIEITSSHFKVKDASTDRVTIDSTGVTVPNIKLTGKITVTSTEDRNVCIGTWSSGDPDVGDDNIVIGTNGGISLGSGATNNILIGTNAGADIITGDHNVIIGSSDIDDSSGSGAESQGIAIGDAHIVGNYSISLGYNNACGQDYAIGIGYNLNASDGTADVAGGELHVGYGGTGGIKIGYISNDTSWAAISDIRAKKNIRREGIGLDFINDLHPSKFEWRAPNDHPKEFCTYDKDINTPRDESKRYGLISQEVKEALENHNALDYTTLWSGEQSDGSQWLAPGELVIPLTKAVQELSAKIDTMQTEINTLKEG